MRGRKIERKGRERERERDWVGGREGGKGERVRVRGRGSEGARKKESDIILFSLSHLL